MFMINLMSILLYDSNCILLTMTCAWSWFSTISQSAVKHLSDRWWTQCVKLKEWEWNSFNIS